MSYDTNSNLISKTECSGAPSNQPVKIIYTYDKASRLTTIEYYSPSSAAPEKRVTFAYNNLDQLISYNDNTTSGTYTYDIKGRKTKETINYGLFTLTNTTTYYANNIKKTHTGPDNITYTYTYDPANNPSEINIPGIGNITYTTNNWTRPSEITLPGGSTKNMTYDPFMRIKNITAKDPAQNTILNYQYAYDKMDNIIDKTTEHGDYHYLYDDLYRLISSDNPESQTIIDENFAYDPAGNRVTSNTTDIYSYTGNNELNAYDDTTCEYDANGNLIKKIVGSIVTGYVYNIEDRLTEIWEGEPETGTLTARYYYDPFGRRLWKEVSGVRTYFHYSDEGLTGEYDADGNEIKAYGYKPGSTWTTDPLFMKEGFSYYFYQNDHLGTPQKLTAVNGTVVWAAKYTSFLKAEIDSASTIENNLRAPGQYYDSETGLHYNRHRYFNCNIGAYLRDDPIGSAKGSNHIYTYSRSNPITIFDSLGLYCEKIGCLPTGFNINKNRDKKDLTGWVLKGANGFGFDWQTATIGGIHCRWKKEIEIIDTYTLTITKTCFAACFYPCKGPYFYTYPDTDTKSFTWRSKDTKQKDLEGAWGWSPNVIPNDSLDKAIAAFLDVATITNQERTKCSQMRKFAGF